MRGSADEQGEEPGHIRSVFAGAVRHCGATPRVRQATGGEGADVILEMIGEDFPEKNLRCLATFGRMVVFGATSGERGTIVPAALMKRCQAVLGFYLPQIMTRPETFPEPAEILGRIFSGDLKLTVGARYPLEKAAEAHEALEGRKSTGKIILRGSANRRVAYVSKNDGKAVESL